MQAALQDFWPITKLAARCMAVVATASMAIAQTGANTGLGGRVSDPTGLAVPDTKVTIYHLETGQQRVVNTRRAGYWEARFLAPGPYQVSFEHKEFKRLSIEGVTVTTAEMTTLDVTLQLGEITFAVTVSSDAPMATFNSATIVRTLDRRELESLPTSSRNFTQLLVIEPGVSADVSELLSNGNASISPSVNGARTTNNSFVFNGVDVTSLLCCNSKVNGDGGTIDEGGGTLSRNIAPAPESLAEVNLETSLYDAATGRNGGGNFRLVSKTGTNKFHGTAYHFLQNDKLIANEFFFKRAGIDRPVLRRNEGGFTAGGPIIKDRTFVFGSYQATRAKTSFVDEASNIVRMPRDLTDDRSDEGIYRFAQVLGVENPDDINPISKGLLQGTFPDGSYLIPSGANGFNCSQKKNQIAETCQVASVIPATYRQDQFSANVDHEWTPTNRISGKFFFANQPSRDPLASSKALSRFEEEALTNQRTFSLTDVHVVNAQVVNEFRAGSFQNRNDIRSVPHFTSAEFGIQNPLAEVRPELSEIRIEDKNLGDKFRFGSIDDVLLDVQNTFTFGDTLSVIKGNHSLKIGGEFRGSRLDGDRQEDQNVKYKFRAWKDFLTVGAQDSKGRARQIRSTQLTYGQSVRKFRMNDWSVFLADDWKVSPRLTLNIGVRYDHFGFPYEANGFLSTFDLAAALESGDLGDGFIFASNFDEASVSGGGDFTYRRASNKSIVPGDWNNIAPRFGFAWSPLGGSRFVLRGGYGVFYERMTGAFVNSLRRAPPFFREAELQKLGDWNIFPADRPTFPIPAFVVGFDDGEPQLESAVDPGNLFEAFETQVIDPRLSTPYTQQWNLLMEWELKPDLLFALGYVGTKGTKLLQIGNTNQAIDVDTLGFLPRPGVPGGGFFGNYFDIVDDEFVNLQTPPASCDLSDDPTDCVIAHELRGPMLGFDEDEGLNTLSSSANSIYNSLQASLEKRYGRHHMFNVNYTFSRSIDTFSDEGVFQIEHDQTRPFLNRALSDFHRKHRLISSWTWDLPLRGHYLLKGWSISGIGTFQSGRPFSIVGTELSGFLFYSQNPRPNLAPGTTHQDLVTNGSVTSRVDRYLNPDAVVQSGPQFGNLGRNTVMGPGQRRVDLAVSKLTSLGESTSVEFRAEFFNALNMVNFRRPESDLTSGSFGEITRTRGGPRVIQFGLKLRF